MPRNVRNFWIEGGIDGRPSTIAGGPVGKDGGIYLTVKMRRNGEIADALRIEGIARSDGTLRLTAHVIDHELVDDTHESSITIETTR